MHIDLFAIHFNVCLIEAKRRTKWLDLEKLQNDQCEAYDIEKKIYEKET